MISRRWGEVQERQLQQFERSSEVLTPYETGGLAALRVIAPDEVTRDRIDAVRAREERRAKQSKARQVRKVEHRLDKLLDDAFGHW